MVHRRKMPFANLLKYLVALYVTMTVTSLSPKVNEYRVRDYSVLSDILD